MYNNTMVTEMGKNNEDDLNCHVTWFVIHVCENRQNNFCLENMLYYVYHIAILF